MRTKAAMALLVLLLASGLRAEGQQAKQAPPQAVSLPAAVTFTEHIAPIVFQQCVSCHRPGEVGPFSLLTYNDVHKKAKLAQRLTESRTMPPWHPEPGHGEFRSERRLTDTQIALFKRWVESGMAEGDPAKLPKPPQYVDGWHLGKPDLVVTMDKAFEVPATGRDIYRNFVLPLNLTEDKWVTAIELRPTARPVVHHVLFFLDTTGKARARDGQDGQPGYRGAGFSSG